MKKNTSAEKINLITISLDKGILRIDVNWKVFYKMDLKKWEMLRSEIAPWLFFRYLDKKYIKKNLKNKGEANVLNS